jgi:3-hydroxyacyl-CoA dehydrogenase
MNQNLPIGRVEIIRGYNTGDEVTTIMTLSEEIGKKTPVRGRDYRFCL